MPALKVEQKDLFVDLRSNKGGIYMKISERTGNVKNTILFPASGVKKLRDTLTEVLDHVPEDKRLSRLRRERGIDDDLHDRSVFVSGLSWSTDEESLKSHMSNCGEIVLCSIMRRGKKKSMGCGVVEYSTRDAAQNAINMMNNTELDGRTLHCREDRKVDENGNLLDNSNQSHSHLTYKKLDDKRIYVHNLSPDTTNATLFSYFSVIGSIVNAEVIRNYHGVSTGSGFVEFAVPQCVEMAISQLNNQTLDNRTIKVKEYYGRT